MKLLVLATIFTCAWSFDPVTLITAAAKAKAAGELADGAADILDNLSDIFSNEGEDLADKSTQQSQNVGILLDILKSVNDGTIKVAKRGLIPERDELLERLGKLYDRVRATVNGAAETGGEAYAEALDQIKLSYERFKSFKSLSWLHRWLDTALTKIEKKFDEYERANKVKLDKREVLPPRDVLVEKMADLYDRLEKMTNERADQVLDVYKALLDQAREAYEKVQRFKSLQWLKQWITEILDKIDAKLQEYSERVAKREVIPAKEELLARLGRLYDRVRAYVNSGADTAMDAYKEGLDYIRYLIQKLENIRQLKWLRKWIAVALDRAEQKLNEYENRDNVVSVLRREVIPPKEEVVAKIANLYDRIEGFVNTKADDAMETYKSLLDEVRYVYEKVERFKSLGWLKKWIEDTLTTIQTKLDEYDRQLKARIKAAEERRKESEAARNKNDEKRNAATDFIHDKIEHLSELQAALNNAVRGKANAAVRAMNFALADIRQAYQTMANSKSVTKLTSIINRASQQVERRVNDFISKLEHMHENTRRDVTKAMEQHFDQRTARGIGDSISGFFKKQWQKVNQTFVGFADKSKESWKELIEEVKPIIANVQTRGYQLLEDTKAAAHLVRESALKTIDKTIEKMLQTANKAVLDGKEVVDIIRDNIENMAQEII